MAKPLFDVRDAFEGDPDGDCYPALLSRVDAIIKVMCPNGLRRPVADAIRRHAIREVDPLWADFIWPGDVALADKPWAKQIAACAAHGAPPVRVPRFSMSTRDVMIALASNVTVLSAARHH